MGTQIAEVKISGEAVEKLNEILKSLDAIIDDLPGQAKAALGLLKSILKGKPKESLNLELDLKDVSKLAESLADIEHQLGEIEDREKKPGTIKELRSAIVELVKALTMFLKGTGQSYPSYGPGYGYQSYGQPYSYYGKAREGQRILASAILREAVEGSEGSEWMVQLIKAGMSENRHMYSHEVLAKALPLFEGIKAYVDHPKKTDTERSVRDIAGWFEDVTKTDEGIDARFVVSESQPWLKALLLDTYQKRKEDLVGFSIFAEGKTRLQRDGDHPYWLVESLDTVKSVDVVAEPAAGGKVRGLAESTKREVEELETLEKLSIEELKSVRPDLFEQIAEQAAKKAAEKYGEPGEGFVCDGADADNQKDCEAKGGKWMKKAAEAKKKKKDEEDEEEVEEGEIPPGLAAYIAKKKKKKEEETVSESLTEAKKVIQSLQLRESRMIVQEALAKSDLPKPVKDRIEKSFNGKIVDAEQIQQVITEEKDVFAKLLSDKESPFVPRIREMQAPEDKYAKAFDGMISGETASGIKPFRSLKEAYSIIKGIPITEVDPYEILAESKGYTSTKRLVESVETGSWTEILGDSITRKLLKEYRVPALDEWRLLCSDIVPLSDFRTQRRVRLGGYGTLPTVAEGGTYQELTSPTDEEETYTPAKKGGLEDLTIETIANDDLGAVRRIPVRLARAAKVTLYRYVFTLITGNPTMGDGNSLFDDTNHGNLGSTALSSAALTVAKRKMRDQTAYGTTTEFLQIMPKFLLVPNELEATARLLATADLNPDTALLATGGASVAVSNQPNIHRGTVVPVIVDFWTDADNWYLIADPKLMNTIELGFLGGKEEPELFTQDQPTVGSMFTADKISYKIRHIYGGVPLDWRSFFMAGV